MNITPAAAGRWACTQFASCSKNRKIALIPPKMWNESPSIYHELKQQTIKDLPARHLMLTILDKLLCCPGLTHISLWLVDGSQWRSNLRHQQVFKNIMMFNSYPSDPSLMHKLSKTWNHQMPHSLLRALFKVHHHCQVFTLWRLAHWSLWSGLAALPLKNTALKRRKNLNSWQLWRGCLKQATTANDPVAGSFPSLRPVETKASGLKQKNRNHGKPPEPISSVFGSLPQVFFVRRYANTCVISTRSLWNMTSSL